MHADFFGLQFFFDTDFKIWGKLQNMPALKKQKLAHDLDSSLEEDSSF